MAFGWSAGDILAAINFIIDVANALDDVDGAAKDFRETTSFLRALNAALTPLQTFTTLDAKPAYKKDIEVQVEAVKSAVEKFIYDVRDLERKLGNISDSRFRHVKYIPSKLKWHFSTRDKALVLQKSVEQHLRIIDTLMQRLAIEMLDTIQKSFQGDVGKSLEDRLNVHLPALQSALMTELSQRDIETQQTWQAQLELLLERYLGSQNAILPAYPALQPAYGPGIPVTELKDHVQQLKPRARTFVIENNGPINGLSASSIAANAIQDWWRTSGSDLLWIQDASQDGDNVSIASQMVALNSASDDQVPSFTHSCQTSNATDNVKLLFELLKAFIYRLCCSLVDEKSQASTSTCNIDPARFAALNSSAESVRDSLTLLDELLPLVCDRYLVVISGFEELENSPDAKLEALLRDFLEIMSKERSLGPSIKTLIVSQEYSQLLVSFARPDRAVDSSVGSSLEGYFSLSDFVEGRSIGLPSS